jgi:hypothetical protein
MQRLKALGGLASSRDTTSIILTLPPIPRSTRSTCPGLVIVAGVEGCLSLGGR